MVDNRVVAEADIAGVAAVVVKVYIAGVAVEKVAGLEVDKLAEAAQFAA